MSQPRKPEPRAKLTRPVSFRLTAADHAAYVEKVEASGMKPSAFFRDVVLANKTQIVARAPASDDKRKLIYHANKAGNNINQLAHRAHLAHLAGQVSEATYTAILTELQLITDAMKQAIRDVD
ncbi:MAG: plasmid mobilization protein [Dermatophilaceae bacterium]